MFRDHAEPVLPTMIAERGGVWPPPSFRDHAWRAVSGMIAEVWWGSGWQASAWLGGRAGVGRIALRRGGMNEVEWARCDVLAVIPHGDHHHSTPTSPEVGRRWPGTVST